MCGLQMGMWGTLAAADGRLLQHLLGTTGEVGWPAEAQELLAVRLHSACCCLPCTGI